MRRCGLQCLIVAVSLKTASVPAYFFRQYFLPKRLSKWETGNICSSTSVTVTVAKEQFMRSFTSVLMVPALLLLFLEPQLVMSACCYFAAKDKDILQPSQKAFITWDPATHTETFTVQPKFAGNAADFGMVIPTPSQPRLDEMPRDFFKELAVYTILKNREYPQSKLLVSPGRGGAGAGGGGFGGGGFGGGFGGAPSLPRRPSVKVLEAGVVGSLDYKILSAGRADDLFTWLKARDYHYSGDEATLDFYVKKKWFFTVMKIDTLQMKRKADGTFDGEVTPTRLQFHTAKLVYPLKITQISVKEKTEALFYVQAPYKTDLPDDMTYQFQWIPMLQNAQGWYRKGIFGPEKLPGHGDQWLQAASNRIPKLLKRGRELGFNFVSGKRPEPNHEGRIAATLEWAKLLTADDIKQLNGDAPFSEKVPDVDEGYSTSDLKDAKTADATRRVIQERLDKDRRERPGGYLVREAPEDEVAKLRILKGHLQEGQFLTKFRKTFTKGEMDDDLFILPAKLGPAEDRSEYEEILPTSPP
jgi:hypothetical protein